jgi:hypothetical protein
MAGYFKINERKVNVKLITIFTNSATLESLLKGKDNSNGKLFLVYVMDT